MFSKRQVLFFAFIVVASYGSPLFARDWIVPAAAHAPGAANTNWRSDLRIVNPSGTPADVRIDLLPQGSNNSTRSPSANVTVPVQGQLSLVDVLASKFSFSGNAALYVSSGEQSLVITSRTYNEAAGGSTYGQFIPGVAVTDALGAGQQGHLIYVTKSADYRTNVGFAGTTATADGTFGQDVPAVAVSNALSAGATAVFSGLSDSGYRTNAGFFNLTSSAIDLTLTLKRPDGSVQATKPFHLDGNMMTQVNLFALMGAARTATASLTVSGSGSGSYLGRRRWSTTIRAILSSVPASRPHRTILLPESSSPTRRHSLNTTATNARLPDQRPNARRRTGRDIGRRRSAR
jgi:hypothetical protein